MSDYVASKGVSLCVGICQYLIVMRVDSISSGCGDCDTQSKLLNPRTKNHNVPSSVCESLYVALHTSLQR